MAVDADAAPTKRWTRSLEGSLTTPTVAGDIVYVTREVPGDDEPRAVLEAFALDTGEHLWRTPLDTPFHYTAPYSNHRPVVHESTVYVAVGDAVSALDARSGEPMWEGPVDGAITDPPTVTDAGAYVIVSATEAGQSGHQSTEQLVAFDTDGAERWRRPVQGHMKPRLVAAAGEHVYLSDGGDLSALEPSSGEPTWSHTTGQEMTEAAVRADTAVRAALTDPVVEAVATDGERRWATDASHVSPRRPVLTDRTAFVAGIEGAVTAIDLDAGERLWQDTLGDRTWTQETPPVVAGDSLLVPRSDGTTATIHALDVDSGERQWRHSIPATRIRGPVAVQGALLVTTQDRHVNAEPEVNATTGPGAPMGKLRAFDL